MENVSKSLLTDQVIASDLLICAKTSVKSYAAALTEASSPEVRDTLRRQLDDAINGHEKVAKFMEKKGWYKPFDINAQIRMDIQSCDQAISNVSNVFPVSSTLM